MEFLFRLQIFNGLFCRMVKKNTNLLPFHTIYISFRPFDCSLMSPDDLLVLEVPGGHPWEASVVGLSGRSARRPLHTIESSLSL